jgi:hypothetical protein
MLAYYIDINQIPIINSFECSIVEHESGVKFIVPVKDGWIGHLSDDEFALTEEEALIKANLLCLKEMKRITQEYRKRYRELQMARINGFIVKDI